MGRHGWLALALFRDSFQRKQDTRRSIETPTDQMLREDVIESVE